MAGTVVAGTVMGAVSEVVDGSVVSAGTVGGVAVVGAGDRELVVVTRTRSSTGGRWWRCPARCGDGGGDGLDSPLAAAPHEPGGERHPDDDKRDRGERAGEPTGTGSVGRFGHLAGGGRHRPRGRRRGNIRRASRARSGRW